VSQLRKQSSAESYAPVPSNDLFGAGIRYGLVPEKCSCLLFSRMWLRQPSESGASD
jgi:hypothetical protein